MFVGITQSLVGNPEVCTPRTLEARANPLSQAPIDNMPPRRSTRLSGSFNRADNAVPGVWEEVAVTKVSGFRFACVVPNIVSSSTGQTPR